MKEALERAVGTVSGDWGGEFIGLFSLEEIHGDTVQYRRPLKKAEFAYYIPKWFLKRIPRGDAEEEWPGSLVVEIENADNFPERDEADSAAVVYRYKEPRVNSKIYEITHRGRPYVLYLPNEIVEGKQFPKRLRVRVSE